MRQEKEIVIIDIVTKNADNYGIKEQFGDFVLSPFVHEYINEDREVFEPLRQKGWLNLSGLEFTFNWARKLFDEETWEYNISLELSDVSWDLFSRVSDIAESWDKVTLYCSNYDWAGSIGRYSNQEGRPTERCFYYFEDFVFERFYEKNIVHLDIDNYEDKELFNDFKEIFEALYWEWEYYTNEKEYSKACRKMEDMERRDHEFTL